MRPKRAGSRSGADKSMVSSGLVWSGAGETKGEVEA